MIKSKIPSTIQSTAIILMILLVAALIGCSRSEKAPSGSSTPPPPAKSVLTVKGSDTMVHLVSSWAEDFMKASPNIQVSVTGGGSGTGIAALLNGTTDIAASSRNIKEDEKSLAEQKGLKIQEITVGRDAISIVVNPSNLVGTLTMEQLKDIFTGKISSWKEAGGPDQPILVYSRESSSGTYVFFQEHVLKKEDYAQTVRLMPATSAIIEAVSADKAGIGYVGLGYADKAKEKVKILGIKANVDSSAVIPSEKTVLDGSYPIARALYLYTSETLPPAAKQFVDYTLSSQGQRIVQESGYIPNSEKQ